MKIDIKIKKYGTLNNIYAELGFKGYSVDAATRFVSRCGVMSKNMQQLRPNISMKKLNECLREARKERRMY